MRRIPFHHYISTSEKAVFVELYLADESTARLWLPLAVVYVDLKNRYIDMPDWLCQKLERDKEIRLKEIQ